MLYSIYKITNKINSKAYIGFTEDIDRRWKQHVRDSKSNQSRAIYRAIRKHGIESFSFEVLYQSKERKHTLTIMEPYFIKLYRGYSEGYNMNEGGSNNNTDKLRRASSERMKANNPMKVLRTNNGSFKKGHKPVITEERNDKISKSKLGKNNPNYGKPKTSDRLNKYIECPHCNKKTNLGNAKRWHFDNCKYKRDII